MPATKFYNWSGRIKWAKVYDHNKDTKYDPEGIYTINFYPKDVEAVKASGIQTSSREDEDGVYFTLRRKHEQLFGKKLEVLGPPEVKYQKLDYMDAIGNLSEVIINVAVFDTRKGKGHRLERVTITKLVEYVPEVSADDEIPF
jgi:hypothetical protein